MGHTPWNPRATRAGRYWANDSTTTILPRSPPGDGGPRDRTSTGRGSHGLSPRRHSLGQLDRTIAYAAAEHSPVFVSPVPKLTAESPTSWRLPSARSAEIQVALAMSARERPETRSPDGHGEEERAMIFNATYLAPGQRYIRADLAAWRADQQVTIVDVKRGQHQCARVTYRCPSGRVVTGERGGVRDRRRGR